MRCGDRTGCRLGLEMVARCSCDPKQARDYHSDHDRQPTFIESTVKSKYTSGVAIAISSSWSLRGSGMSRASPGNHCRSDLVQVQSTWWNSPRASLLPHRRVLVLSCMFLILPGFSGQPAARSRQCKCASGGRVAEGRGRQSASRPCPHNASSGHPDSPATYVGGFAISYASTMRTTYRRSHFCSRYKLGWRDRAGL